MSEIKEAFVNGWLKEDPRLVAAVLLGIFTFIVLNVLLYKSEKNKKKLKQQAIENNTVVTARIVSRYHDHRDESGFEYSGRYKYTVNGKTKKYSVNLNFPAPDTLELYPKNSSQTKFFSDYDRTANAGVAFNFIAAVAICLLILKITGYID